MIRPFCAACERELKPRTNGILAVAVGDDGPYECYEADLWCCPKCQAEIVLGIGRSPIAMGLAACRKAIESADNLGQMVFEVNHKTNAGNPSR